MEKTKTLKYDDAVKQLEAIATKMESGELDVDSVCEQLKTAKKLIKFCKDRLARTDEEVKKLLDE